MAHIKTAISIDADVFKDVQRGTHQIHISRSRLFEIAARDWLKKQQQKLLIQQINSVVEQDTFDEQNHRQMELMRDHQRKLVQDTW